MSTPRRRHSRIGQRIGGRASDATVTEDRAGSSASELRELREVVALLRGLPDPEPPAGLTDRVLARVAQLESRRWPRVFRGGIAPLLGSALAAGLGGLLLLTAAQRGSFENIGFLGVERAASPALLGSNATAAGGGSLRMRRPVTAMLPPAAVVGPQVVFFGGQEPASELAEFEPVKANPIERGLDRQLNLMLLDPHAFFQRLETVQQRDRFIARLAARAASRGDAPQMALRLRAVPHRFAETTSDQFLKASLAQYASGR